MKSYLIRLDKIPNIFDVSSRQSTKFICRSGESIASMIKSNEWRHFEPITSGPFVDIHFNLTKNNKPSIFIIVNEIPINKWMVKRTK